jgi:hypothetical protein
MHRIAPLTLGLLLMTTPPSSAQTPAPEPSSPPATNASEVGIDHLILAIDDLQKGIETFARMTGVRPEFGGEHPGRGTANALVSLGKGRYLELLAPASRESRIDPSWGDTLKHTALTPVGWALHTRNLAKTVAALRGAGLTVSDPQPGSRKRADGSVLNWQTAALTGPQLGLEPFVIQWGEGTAHPSATSPQGCELVSVKLTAPEPENLRKLLKVAGVDVPVAQGSPEAMTFTLRCGPREITFPAPEPEVVKE